MRMMAYDRAANERNAVSALRINGVPLSWHRLDDGVMGGQSETSLSSKQQANNQSHLHFAGTINTNGGGFTSIRTPIPKGQLLTADTTAIRLRFRGDGKTYKLLFSDGMSGGPGAKSPSWQADLPTNPMISASATTANDDSAKKDDPGQVDWQEAVVPLDALYPNFVGGFGRFKSREDYVFDPTAMVEMGLMLSLQLSDGRPNPQATFGQGTFPFSLHIQSIETISSSSEGDKTTDSKDSSDTRLKEDKAKTASSEL